VFLAVVLAGAVIGVYQIFQPDGLAVGYVLIAVGVVAAASFLWSQMRRPRA
jgi:hypothetical protein